VSNNDAPAAVGGEVVFSVLTECRTVLRATTYRGTPGLQSRKEPIIRGNTQYMAAIRSGRRGGSREPDTGAD
jgi:hypothetical protein